MTVLACFCFERVGIMAKDMSKVYADMLTKELVRLRRDHMSNAVLAREFGGRKGAKEAERLNDLIRQINHELACRVAQMGIFA